MFIGGSKPEIGAVLFSSEPQPIFFPLQKYTITHHIMMRIPTYTFVSLGRAFLWSHLGNYQGKYGLSALLIVNRSFKILVPANPFKLYKFSRDCFITDSHVIKVGFWEELLLLMSCFAHDHCCCLMLSPYAYNSPLIPLNFIRSPNCCSITCN